MTIAPMRLGWAVGCLLLVVGGLGCAPQGDSGFTWRSTGGRLWVSGHGVQLSKITAVVNVHGAPDALSDGTVSSSVGPVDDALGHGTQEQLHSDVGPLTIGLRINDYGKDFIVLQIDATNHSSQPITVDGFTLQADPIGGSASPVGTLSDGYQSWSSTEFAKLARGRGDDLIAHPVANNGESLRVDSRESWWMGLLHFHGADLVSGAITAERWKTRVLTYTNAGVRWLLVDGRLGTSLQVAPGDTVSSERLFIGIDADPHAVLDAYASAVAGLYPKPVPPFVPVGWNSWNTLFGAVTEQDVLANATFLHDQLPQAPFNNVQIDDGWEQGWGIWQANSKFPSGMAGVAQQIKALGYHPGVWMAPFVVNTTAPVATAHPDWLLHNADGTLLRYSNPSGTHYVLDVTHPDARAWIVAQVQHMLDAGYRYLKLDFLFAATYEGRHYDPSQTPLQAYRATMQAIFAAAHAAGAYVLACGAPILPTAGVADGIRTSMDIAGSASLYATSSVKNVFRNVALRYWVNRFLASDPDTPMLRSLDTNAAQLTFSAALITGPIFALGDDLPTLSTEQRALLKTATGSLALQALAEDAHDSYGAEPVDLLGAPINPPGSLLDLLLDPSYPVPDLWQVPLADGSHLLAVLNWSNEPHTHRVELDFAPHARQAVEMWSKTSTPITAGTLTVNTPPLSGQLFHIQ